MILLNLHFGSARAHLVFRAGEGKRTISEEYSPHFFAVCDSPEENSYLISQHPCVLSASVERGAVKITAGMRDFRKVVEDVRAVRGVRELYETALPHHFRYSNSRRLEFFADYDETDDPRNLAVRRGAQEDPAPVLAQLRLGAVFQEKNRMRLRILGEDGEEFASLASATEKLDVIFSHGGDDFLRGVPGVSSSPLGCFLRSAIHLDVRSDIRHDIYDEPSESGLFALGRERLVRVMELSAMTGAKPDLIPRISAGKLNTYLHFAAAKELGILIPDRRKEVERPKPLPLLRAVDKGGLIFYPPAGVYGEVAKCDFASMYPNIIVGYNISPETMHCRCGDDFEVPEAGWRICRKKGLIPRGLEKVLRRRLTLKRMMKAEADPARRQAYSLRQRALKNILVTCFGYLGYSNFIFSNVECKECTVLLGRHVLARTKRIAEEEGLEVLYGIVDSVFVRGGSGADYRRFAGRASREFGFELEIDCVFRRLAFPSSARGCSAANKYYGITAGGKIEARGIAIRHSDSPEFIRRFQERAIRELLAEDGFRPERLGPLLREHEGMLRSGAVGAGDLAITKSVRKDGYRTRQAHFEAYRQSAMRGGDVTFVFTVHGPKPLELAAGIPPDVPAYSRLLHQAAAELVCGIC